MTIASLQLDPDQKQTLRTGTPQDKISLIESMPADQQWNLLEALPQGMRQRLINTAPVDLRRKLQLFNGPMQVVNQDLIEGKLLRAAFDAGEAATRAAFGACDLQPDPHQGSRA